jgi:hypothetical protein
MGCGWWARTLLVGSEGRSRWGVAASSVCEFRSASRCVELTGLHISCHGWAAGHLPGALLSTSGCIGPAVAWLTIACVVSMEACLSAARLHLHVKRCCAAGDSRMLACLRAVRAGLPWSYSNLCLLPCRCHCCCC